MPGLIVLDVFGTLIGPRSHTDFRRPKVKEFFEMNPGYVVTLFTDACEGKYKEVIKKGIADLGIRGMLNKHRFYGESLDRGSMKNLSKVSEELGFALDEIVMIGDSFRDIRSAEKYGTKLVVVPYKGPFEPAMSMDLIGNLDELFDEHKAAWFYHRDGEFRHALGGYELNPK